VGPLWFLAGTNTAGTNTKSIAVSFPGNAGVWGASSPVMAAEISRIGGVTDGALLVGGECGGG